MSDEILDLNEFLDRVQNDKELLAELLDIFSEDFKEKMKALKEAVAGSDVEQVKSIAHSLKGASGNISAKNLREVIVKLEEMGKNGDLSGADQIVQEMDLHFEALEKHIPEIKSQLNL